MDSAHIIGLWLSRAYNDRTILPTQARADTAGKSKLWIAGNSLLYKDYYIAQRSPTALRLFQYSGRIVGTDNRETSAHRWSEAVYQCIGEQVWADCAVPAIITVPGLRRGSSGKRAPAVATDGHRFATSQPVTPAEAPVHFDFGAALLGDTS